MSLAWRLQSRCPCCNAETASSPDAGPPPVVLSLATALPAAVPQGPCLISGADWEIFDFTFVSFGLETLRQDWHSCPYLEASARQFVDQLPVWQRGTPFQAMHLFVDGSYFEAGLDIPARAGWAICVLVQVQDVWCWAGFLAASCCVEGGPASLGTQVTSAFQTELSAIVFALAVCLANPVPAAIAFDCSSAGEVAGVLAQTDACPALGKAACDIQAVLRLLGRGPALYHVKSHAGHPMNCLADGVAKWAAKETSGDHAVPETLADASNEGLLPWFWTLFAPRGSLPEGSASGKISDVGSSSTSSTLAQALEPYRAPPRVDCELSFQVATYNCLTVASAAQRESIDAQLDKQGVAVAMLQETRADLSGRFQTAQTTKPLGSADCLRRFSDMMHWAPASHLDPWCSKCASASRRRLCGEVAPWSRCPSRASAPSPPAGGELFCSWSLAPRVFTERSEVKCSVVINRCASPPREAVSPDSHSRSRCQ